MFRNIKLKIAYDGTSFLGWQETKEGPSIEATLKEVLQKVLQENIELQAASRTDRGVHARAQVVNFFSKKSFSLSKLMVSLNQLLPKEIRALAIEEMASTFHPTLDTIGKKYTYEICNSSVQLPHFRHISWHIPLPLDLKLMEKAIPHLIGFRDFSSFCNSRKNMNYKDKERKISSLRIDPLPFERFEISVVGSHFLYKMVRNLVGTLVYIGLKKIEVHQLGEILQSKKRAKSGMTAPAHGLHLVEVFYPEEVAT